MSKLDKIFETIRESETFQQLKGKYDELDGQAKLYVNLGAVAAVVLFIFLTIFIGMAKVNGLKSEINEREELIGYLQRSADTIKQLKAQQSAQSGNTDVSSPLQEFVESSIPSSGLARGKIEFGGERNGVEDKETREVLLDIKVSQANIKQLTKFIFTLVDLGASRQLNVKDLVVDTKGDPSGYLEANMTIAGYKAK